MTREDLVEHVRRSPFVPIRITLTTGRTFDVYHPDMIMVGRRDAVIGVTRDPADIFYERAVYTDLFHIVTVEPLPPPTPVSSDGLEGEGPAA